MNPISPTNQRRSEECMSDVGDAGSGTDKFSSPKKSTNYMARITFFSHSNLFLVNIKTFMKKTSKC